jgi:hypothetical protein
LCAAPSQGIVTRPGTRNVAFTFPVDITAASSCFITTTSGLRLLDRLCLLRLLDLTERAHD